MKNLLLMIICVIVFTEGVHSQSYTTISTNIISNTTWTTGTTYYIDNDIEVNNSAILTIEPGVIVKFALEAGLRNYATISAIGSSGSEIYFTSINDNSVGEIISGSTGIPASGDWDGILLYQHSASFDYCNIYYGGNSSGGTDANIQFYYCGVGNQFTNCESKYSARYGVRSQQTALILTGNVINDNGLTGFYHTESTASYGVNFSNNILNNNGGYAAEISAGYLQDFSNNAGTGNSINGFSVQGTLDNSSLTLTGYNSSFPLILGGRLTIKDGQTLVLPAGTVVKAESNGYLMVSGILDVNGTSSNKVIFTSSKDDNYGGDTYGDGNATSPAPGDWKKIAVNGSNSKVYLEYFNVLYGGGDGNQSNIVFYVNSDAGTISNCEFMYSLGYGIWANEAILTIRSSRLANNNNAGIYIRTSTLNYIPNLGTTTEDDWGNNDFDGNANYAIINNSGLNISAYRNYWGATSSDGILAKINNMSGSVYFNPWIDDNPLPVELTSFTAKIIDGSVKLNWHTATEVNNYGFNVECRIESARRGGNGEWETKGFVQGNGTTNSLKSYSFTDTSLPDANEVSYRLKQIDNDGTFTYSKIVTVDLTTVTSVNDELNYEFSLAQNYPNPFNPSTTIKFTVPSNVRRETSNVKLMVYDILGREVATLVNQKLQSDNHEINFDASNLPSGIYIYRINVNNELNSTKKMMLIK